MNPSPLRDRLIALPETRELDLFAALLERRGAALDHPVVLNIPETEYLKCLVLEVE